MANIDWRQATPQDTLGANWTYFVYTGFARLAFRTIHAAVSSQDPFLTHVTMNGTQHPWRYHGINNRGQGFFFDEGLARINEEDVPPQVRNALKEAWGDFVDGWGG
jgi:hypothetical protein